MGIEFLILFLQVFVVFNVAMGMSAFCTWVERKGSALIQDRIGANRAGAFYQVENPLLAGALLGSRVGGIVLLLVAVSLLVIGQGTSGFAKALPDASFLLAGAVVGFLMFALSMVPVLIRGLGILGVINTLVCDAVKALTKEDFIPTGVSPFLHALAPILAALPIFLAFSVVPLAPDFEVFGYVIRPQVAQLNAGILFFLAMGSMAVYGVALAGWTSNNKFSLLGSLRASAQMISYELALGVAIVTAILMYGTLDLYEMVQGQSQTWGALQNPFMFIACIIFFVAGMAETKRGPFDLPESESELVAGYFTEYSGMKFLLFWMGEFTEIALFALVLALVFFGGWHPLPFFGNLFTDFIAFPENSWVGALVGHAILMGKVIFLCVLQIVIRWTLPRFRYDQLMDLGWKWLLEIGFLNLMLLGAFKLLGYC
jgi:NADH-quinone oxidoreductase subunit H